MIVFNIKKYFQYILSGICLCISLLLGPSYAFGISVLLQWQQNQEPEVTGYNIYYGNFSGSYDQIIDAGNNNSYLISDLDREKIYFFALKAYSDTSESDFSDEIQVSFDNAPPSGSIIINNGQPATTSQTVTLYLQADDADSGMGSGAQMKFSNDNINWSTPVSFTSNYTWTLSTGFGQKTVYAKFKDIAGNWMPSAISDTITYEQISQDSDGDDIPDDWEIANGLNPNDSSDAVLDNDTDGKTNLEEYLEGSNPNDPTDNRPVANAGSDITTDPTLVTLDGSLSSDPNGNLESFLWTQITGPQVTINDSDKLMANFIGVKRGLYIFQLIVNDGRIDSLPDMVNVTINNVAPTADPGDNQTVTINTEVSLDGSASTDANLDTLTYQWSQTSGTPVSIQHASEMVASFTPDETGVYSFALTVSDGLLEDSNVINITVNDPQGNTVPVADAGEDQTVMLGSVVKLDGSGSTDADGDTLQYIWEIVSGPAEDTLQNASSATAEFTPSISGIYLIALSVSDGTDTSLEDYVTVTVNNPPSDDSGSSDKGGSSGGGGSGSGGGGITADTNTVPVALAGNDQEAFVGDTVTLDGSGSYDDDGDILGYQWTQISGTTVALSNASSSQAEFYAIYEGTFTFSLIVNDGKTPSIPDTVIITVYPVNHRPIADAGQNVYVHTDEDVVLDGTESYDIDGDELTYNWLQVSGPEVNLIDADSANPSFHPIDAGSYKFELLVSDGALESEPDSVVITVEETPADTDNEILLISPENEATISEAPVFQWKANGYDGYRVRISIDGIRFYTIGVTSEQVFALPTLWTAIINSQETAPIYWKILGKNIETDTWDESETWMFFIKGTGGDDGNGDDSPKDKIKKQIEKFIELLKEILKPRYSESN